jgi:hypothetical protein
MRRLAASFILLLGCLAPVRAEDPCARCHPSEAAAFERSPMGRSLGPPSVFAEGRIVHKLSGSTITIQRRGALLEHKLEQRGVTAKYPVAYSVGDGIVGSLAGILLHAKQELGPDAGLRDGSASRLHAPDHQRLPILPHRHSKLHWGNREPVRRSSLHRDLLRTVPWFARRAPRQARRGIHREPCQVSPQPP